MGFLSGLGLILLTMVGFSIGRVLPAKKYHVSAELFDGVAMLTLWVLALTTQFAIGWKEYLLWIVIGLVTGFLLTLVVRSSLQPVNYEANDLSGKNFFAKVWEAWKAFAFRMGSFQGRLILLFFYFTILAPFGLVNTLFRDALNMKKKPVQSFWFPLEADENNIEGARRQF